MDLLNPQNSWNPDIRIGARRRPTSVEPSPYPGVADSSVRVEAVNNIKVRIFSATSCGCAKAFVTRRCKIFRVPQESGWQILGFMSGTVSMHEVPLQPRPHAEGLGYSPDPVYNDRTRTVSSISILL